MTGNVYEWTQDWHHTDYSQPGRPDDGSAWETQQAGHTTRVIRGGSYTGNGRNNRSAVRPSNNPTTKIPNIGFRPAWKPD